MTPGPYPVMAFIHGGGFTAGGSIQMPGNFLAAHDIILVMINYRLDSIGKLQKEYITVVIVSVLIDFIIFSLI